MTTTDKPVPATEGLSPTSGSPTRRPAGPKAPKVLRAERLELVDSEGRVRARLGPKTERYDGKTWRSFRLEVFDLNGTVRASVAVDDSGRTSSVSVGKTAVTPTASLSIFENEETQHSAAHVSLDAGVGPSVSRRTMSAVSGEFPRSSDWGPTILFGDSPNIGDRETLDRVCREAKRWADSCRKRAGETPERRRSLIREARRYEDRIEQAKQAFEMAAGRV